METTGKGENDKIIIFNYSLTKKQLMFIRILLAITLIAGVTLFFMKHS